METILLLSTKRFLSFCYSTPGALVSGLGVIQRCAYHAVGACIIMIFNPFLLCCYKLYLSFLCPWYIEDECFYPELTHLEEYVLNTSGRIWTGTYNSHSVKPWHFDQFHHDCLEVALTMLEQLPFKERGNPILVNLMPAYHHLQICFTLIATHCPYHDYMQYCLFALLAHMNKH